MTQRTHEDNGEGARREQQDTGEDNDEYKGAAEEGPDCTPEAARHLEAEYQQVSHEKFMVAHDSQPLAGAWDSKPRRSV